MPFTIGLDNLNTTRQDRVARSPGQWLGPHGCSYFPDFSIAGLCAM